MGASEKVVEALRAGIQTHRFKIPPRDLGHARYKGSNLTIGP